MDERYPHGKMCDAERQALIDKLSLCSHVLDLPPEMVLAMLRIQESDAWKLVEIIRLAQKVKIESPEQMKEILDLARVARIMEEQQEPIGPASFSGPTGAQSPTGPTGPSPKMDRTSRNKAMSANFKMAYGVKGPIGPVRGMTVMRRRG
jgi:hypothetical protein